MPKRGFNIEGFRDWLVASGAILQTPTNEWEVLRYQWTDSNKHVLYKNKKDRLTISPEIQAHYKSYLEAMNLAGLPAVEKVRRAHGRQRSALAQKLYDRDVTDDHPTCFYCGQFVDDPTVEHFHAVPRGGRNHPDNCALACEPCNLVAGDKPIVEKIWLREIIQTAVSSIPPWEHFDARQIEGGRP